MFVSGSTYQILQLGQPLAAAAGGLPVAAAHPAQAPQAQANGKRKLSVAVNKPTSSATSAEQRASPAPSKGGGGGNKGGPSLLDLIEAGMLTPGDGNMSVTYKGSTYTGTLQGNGTIAFNGSVFNTPSAFSVHVKRLVTPAKQGDDGWHSVYVNGTLLLNAVRQQYNARAGGQQGSQAQAPAAGAQLGQQQAGAAKVARKQQASPRRQQQPQQQEQKTAGQVRPPLPKLKLGNIKGLPLQQQQQQTSSAGKPPTLPQNQQQQQQGGQPNKLKLKQPLKLSLGKLSGAAGAAGGQQQQQQLAAVAPGSPILLREPLLDDHQVAAVAVQQLPAPAPGNPHWVRCCRCEVWRCVPEASWGAVQAMGSTWYCEDAGWDVTQAEPFSPACLADVWPGGGGGGGAADAHDLLIAML